MKGTNKNRFKQILSLLMIMAVGASTMIVAPSITAKTTDAQPATVQSANADDSSVPNAAVSDTSDPDFEFVSFRSDTQGIPVGTTQNVIFSAEISGNIGTDEHDVSLLDDADHLIGYMLDNGENGDETANDGIFTLQTSLSSDEEKTVNYHPNAKGVDGDTVMIGFYTPASEEAMNQMNDTESEISTFVSSDSFQNKSDEEKAAAAGEYLDQLAQEGKIKSGSVSYDEDSKIYSFEYNTSARGAICLTEFSDDVNGPETDADPINLADQFPMGNTTNASGNIAATNANGSYRALVLDGFESERISYYQGLQSSWNSMGLTTTLDTDVTVGDLKNLGSYDVVVLSMHGNVYRNSSSDPWDPILSLNQSVTTSTDSTYSYELNTRHSVAKVTLTTGRKAYWVFPKLFTDSYSSSGLNGKLIFSESCMFYGCECKGSSLNYNLSNALKNRGAGVVVGYRNSVGAYYSRNAMKYTIDHSFNGETVTQAVNGAKSVYGNDDDWEDRSDDKYKAYPVVNPNGSTFVLRSGTGSSTTTAESISLNSSKTATISTAGTMKYYTITPSSTTQVQFYSTGSYDTYGYLYNSSMTQLASNDDGGTDNNFKITYTLNANTKYYLGCKFYSSTRTGSFTVRLESTAESISLNSSKTATISTAGTMKYYTYTPSSTTQVQFYSTGSYDTYGYLYNSSMSQLASNDDGGTDNNFKITYTLSANTTYIFGCKFYSSSRTGSFTVRLESAAESISLNSGKTATISTAGTMKYYTYTPSSTTQVQFYSTGSYDTYGYLYNSSMSQLASNDDGGEGTNFKITYTLSANTTYYFGCKFYSSSRTGSFNVRLDSAAESISLNSTKTATISTAGTMKYYTFTPTSTTQIQFYSTGSYDTYGYLYNSSMSQLASNDDGGSDTNFKITYTLSANTTYYFGCKFYSSSRTGSFNVRLESAYESISLDTTKTATISTAGTMKYYSFTPTSTTQIQFYSTGSYDTYGYLYNSGMSQLASNDDGGSDANFKITYTVSANTTYYLGCKFYSSSRTGSFNVRLEGATEPITLNSSRTVSINNAGAVKYYSIVPITDVKIQFCSTGSYDTYGYLYDGNMSQLASNDDGGNGNNFKITYTLRANTQYYFGCKFYSSSRTGSFTIRLDSVEIGYVTPNISTAGTTRYYSITPIANKVVTIYSTGSYDTYGYLYDANMNQLASNDDGGDDCNFKITYTLNAYTTYYLGCKFYSSSRTGSFNVYIEMAPAYSNIESLANDDENIDAANAADAIVTDNEIIEVTAEEIAGITESYDEDQTAGFNAETIAQDEETQDIYIEAPIILSE